MLNQFVVTAAARNGAKFFRTIKHFEDDAGIISKSAHDSDIHIDIIGQATSAQTIDNLFELFAFSAFAQDGKYGIGQVAKFLDRLCPRLALRFVDYLQQFVPTIGRYIF